jgi:hypothetical protein
MTSMTQVLIGRMIVAGSSPGPRSIPTRTPVPRGTARDLIGRIIAPNWPVTGLRLEAGATEPVAPRIVPAPPA